MSRPLVATAVAVLTLGLLGAGPLAGAPAGAAAHAATPGDSTGDSTGAATGSISGRALPLGDTSWRGGKALVRIQRQAADARWSTIDSVLVAGRGRYAFDSLEAGTYRVLAKVELLDQGLYAQAYHGTSRTDHRLDTIVLTSGASASGIDVGIDLGSAITGRVTSRGRPVAGVSVLLLRQFTGTNDGTALVVTDSRGAFVMRGLSAGTRRVLFRAPGDRYADRVWPFTTRRAETAAVDVVVPTNGVATGIDGVLARGGTVRGTLTAPQRDLDAYRYALLYRRDGSGWLEAESRPLDQGAYVIAGVDPGGYRVCFGQGPGLRPISCVGGPDLDTASAVRVSAGRATEVDLRAPALSALAGTVRSEDGTAAAGDPATGVARVEVYRSTARGLTAVDSAPIGGDGSYRLEHLAPGSYRVGFIGQKTQEFWPDADGLDEATSVRLRAGRTLRLSSLLDTGAQVSGRFLDRDGDHGIAQVTAFRRARDGGWTAVQVGNRNVPHGFGISGLRPGTYRLGFGADPTYAATTVPVFWPHAGTLASAQDIVVRSLDSRITRKDVDVDPGSVITGYASGDGDVVAYRKVGRRWVEERRGRENRFIGGAFALAGLPAGHYRLAFRGDDDFWAPSFYGPGRPTRIADAKDVVLPADTLLRRNIEPVPAVRNPVRGHVTGTPRVGSTLRVVAGTWSPTGTRLRYRWYAGSRAITGASGTSYVVREGDAGRRISVLVTGQRSGGWSGLRARTRATEPVRSR